jgi:hypothetical protein
MRVNLPAGVAAAGRLPASPFIPHKDAVCGFVFDMAAGKLNEVV